MSKDLTAMMIKTSGNPDNLDPSILSFPLSSTASGFNGFFNAVNELHPNAFNNIEGEPALMLSSKHASEFLSSFINSDPDSIRIDYLQEMLELADKGFSMIAYDA